VRVVDFGIARLFGDEGAWNLTSPGAMIGTPAYIAPEVLGGASPDPRADIYAVGVVLFQIMTGRLPVGDLALPVSGLEHVLRSTLSPTPEGRYQDAGELATALRDARLESAVQAPTVPGKTRARPAPARRSRGRLAAAAAIGATVSAATWLVLAMPGRSSTETPPPTATAPAARAAGAIATTPPPGPPSAPIATTATAIPPAVPPDAAPAPAVTQGAAEVRAPAVATRRRRSRPPRRAPETRASAAVEHGTIVLHVRPWAEVAIDGVSQPERAEPPSARYVVPVGRHRLELHNPATRKRVTRVVVASPGADTPVHVDLR
jgi:serine/threonine-protein kinase